MEKYFINYHTGAGDQVVEVYDLNEAKEIALQGMNYTQQNITIETLQGEVVTESKWIGTEPTEAEEEFVLSQIGSYGFYMRWSDELESI